MGNWYKSHYGLVPDEKAIVQDDSMERASLVIDIQGMVYSKQRETLLKTKLFYIYYIFNE